jgi:hypothetical protein
MAKPVEHKVKTLTDFTQRVEEVLTSTRASHPSVKDAAVNWYRGSGMSEKWKLVPGLYRHPTIADVNDLLRLERKLLASFRREAILYQPTNMSLTHPTGDPAADYEYLFFMQHYGVPTRLLDWTGNPFIALYFALAAAPFDPAAGGYQEDAAVWVLDPIAWNEQSLGHIGYGDKGPLGFGARENKSYAPRASDELRDLVTMYDYPVAVHGVANNTRMFAQKGVFTIFGRHTDPMEKIYDDKGYPGGSLVKLVVEKSDIDNLLRLVLAIGYTDSVSYPDLHGLAMEIKRLNHFKV